MKILIGLLFVIGTTQFVCADDVSPALPGPDGQRAFDDLASFYNSGGKTVPAYQTAVTDLSNGKSTSGQYLLGLLEQCFADETNGRALWKSSPAWGGGSNSPSRDFRKEMELYLNEHADGDNALPIAQWLIKVEQMYEGQQAGIAILRRIHSPEADQELIARISEPNPNEDVLTGAISEAATRKLAAAKVGIISLEKSYRSSVRKAAQEAATKLGDATQTVFMPEEAFTPGLDAMLHRFVDRVPTPVPANAPWVKLSITSVYAPKHSPMVHGWLLDDKSDEYVVLDWQGLVQKVSKKQVANYAVSSLPEAADEIRKIRETKDDNHFEMPLSMKGGMTGQFEPRFISVPEALVAAWSYQRGDKATAAKVLFPCFDEAQDDRWIDEVIRDLLGNRYHQEMLVDFSYHRDYAAALVLAQHLSKPIFDGFNYQDRAKELAKQLPGRMDEFKTFTLPAPTDWATQKASLSRPDQIKFLAEHLRLLNCIQQGQPGGISYDDPQSQSSFLGSQEHPKPAINPYVELVNMKLTPGELEQLAPYILDETFIPTFSYWRDFHPSRTLYCVSWIVGDLINSVARQNLVDLARLKKMNTAEQGKTVDDLKAWCESHKDATVPALLTEALQKAPDEGTFLQTARQCLTDKQPDLLKVAIARLKDFPSARAETEIAQLCFESGSPQFLDQARTWAKEKTVPANADANALSEYTSTFYSGLILLQNGDDSKPEGLDVIRPFLVQDSAANFYPEAVPVLLATKNEAAIQAACGVFKKSDAHAQSWDPWQQNDMLLRLFLSGRVEARDFILSEINDTRPQKGQSTPPATDSFVQFICEWRKDNVRMQTDLPLAKQLEQRHQLADWINAQFDLIREGKPTPLMNVEFSHGVSHWQLDAPG